MEYKTITEDEWNNTHWLEREDYEELDRISFWSQVYRWGNGCWLWGGKVKSNDYNSHGFSSNVYGLFSTNGEDTILAHRMAYILEKGPIPKNHEIHHTCNKTLCVNPNHLVAVTTREHDNIHAPAAAKGRRWIDVQRNHGARMGGTITNQPKEEQTKETG